MKLIGFDLSVSFSSVLLLVLMALSFQTKESAKRELWLEREYVFTKESARKQLTQWKRELTSLDIRLQGLLDLLESRRNSLRFSKMAIRNCSLWRRSKLGVQKVQGRKGPENVLVRVNRLGRRISNWLYWCYDSGTVSVKKPKLPTKSPAVRKFETDLQRQIREVERLLALIDRWIVALSKEKHHVKGDLQ